MEYRYIRYACAEGIATLTIDRPEVRNAMNNDCWRELTSLIQQADQDPGVRVVILTGAGEKAFISGADIRTLQTRTSVESLEGLAIGALQAIEDCSKPVIAAVNGVAFGGGFETALACDLRIVSEKAKFGLPEVNLGILPGAGGTQRLALLAGPAVAREMVLLGRQLRADEALTCGLVTKVVENEATLDTALALAAELCKKPAYALAQAKCAIVTGQNFGVGCGKLFERQLFALTFSNSDQVEGMHAFLERREPRFQNQR